MSEARDPKDDKIKELERSVRGWRALFWTVLLTVFPLAVFLGVTTIISVTVFQWALQNEIDLTKFLKEVHKREIDEQEQEIRRLQAIRKK